MYSHRNETYVRKGRSLILLLLGFDRDLSIAGRVMVKTEKGDYLQKLVRIDKPSTYLSQLNRTYLLNILRQSSEYLLWPFILIARKASALTRKLSSFLLQASSQQSLTEPASHPSPRPRAPAAQMGAPVAQMRPQTSPSLPSKPPPNAITHT